MLNHVSGGSNYDRPLFIRCFSAFLRLKRIEIRRGSGRARTI